MRYWPAGSGCRSPDVLARVARTIERELDGRTRRAIAIRWMSEFVDPRDRHVGDDGVAKRRRRDDVAKASGPPTPSRRCAGPLATPSGSARRRRRGSCSRPAATGRGRRPAPSSSTPFPSCCRCPASARVPSDSASTRARRSCRRDSRPARSRCSSRCRACAAPAAFQHRAGRNEDRGHVHRRRAHHQAGRRSCRNRRAAPRRRPDGARIASSASIASRLR